MKNYLPTPVGYPDKGNSPQPSRFFFVLFFIVIGLLIAGTLSAHHAEPSPENTDKEEILDICIDMVCIGYSLGEVICTGGQAGWVALGADCASAATPFATGGGAAVRATRKGVKMYKGRNALKFNYFAKAGVRSGKWRVPFEVIKNNMDHVFKRHGAHTVARNVSKFYSTDKGAIEILIRGGLKRKLINPNCCKTFLREDGFDLVIDMGKYIGTNRSGQKANLLVLHFNPKAANHKFTAYPACHMDMLPIFRIAK
jgi:hypothetical protein